MSAQAITTPNDTIDCGQVVFKHPVRAQFRMKNESRQTFTITDVRTSCGCTSVSYPSQAIAPGDTFSVSAVYDAKQMGHFQKSVGVYTSASEEPRMLTLRGVVVDRIVNFRGEYPYTIGSLVADKNDLEFDNVNRGDMPMATIHLMNNGTDNVEPQLMHMPPYLKGEVRPSRIAPGHTGTVTLQVDTWKLRDLGLTQTSVFLGMFPGDVVSPDKEISLSVIVMPDFERLTEAQRANAPKLQLSKGSIDIGSFGSKEKKKDEIVITNIGKSTLTIRSMQMLTVGMDVSLSEQNIQPGKSAKLKVTAIKSLLGKARSKPRILLITNDPDDAKVMIPLNVSLTK
jgi:hypothetical protein